jgi:hypothetical protein
MMVLCFAAMLLALATLWVGPRWLPLTSFALCLALSAALFLWEIHSPETGFAMPWLQG